MQVTLYYSEEDKFLLDLVDKLALQQRRSRSAVIMSILEEYFESSNRVGEILVDLGIVSPNAVEEAVKEQEKAEGKRLLGEILVDKGWVKPEDLQRALIIQSRARRS